MLRPYAPPADEPAPASAPRGPSLLVAVPLQLRLLREPFRLRRARAQLAAAPQGSGEPVLVLPGMGVGDLSTGILRRYLRRQGFDAHGWGLGRNRPDVPKNLARMLPRLEALAATTGGRVALVGWSLGGVIARELARLRPDLVRLVVTFGAPVVGGLRSTAVAGLFRVQGWDLAAIERLVAAANAVPIRVPVVAIFSRRDGIVAWPACVDRTSAAVEHLEVDSCHWGLGLDPDVLVATCERLASREL